MQELTIQDQEYVAKLYDIVKKKDMASLKTMSLFRSIHDNQFLESFLENANSMSYDEFVTTCTRMILTLKAAVIESEKSTPWSFSLDEERG